MDGMKRAFVIGGALLLAAGLVVAASSDGSEPRQSVRIADVTPGVGTTQPEATPTTVEAVPVTGEPGLPAVPVTAAPNGVDAPAGQVDPPPAVTVPPILPGVTIPEPPAAGPPGCAVDLVGATVTKSACPDVTTFMVRWYFRCGPGFDVPATLPSGRVITTCPTLLVDVPHAFAADQEGVGAAPDGDANCFTVYLPEPAVFRGSCEN